MASPAPQGRERPIAFSPAMARAIIDGTKWQTRRAITPQPPEHIWGRDFSPVPGAGNLWGAWTVVGNVRLVRDENTLRCPYGAPGDRLWVKEALYRDPEGLVRYVVGEELVDGREIEWDWKPKRLGAMYCPRWASRITLEVTEVRVQRVQDISEDDARAEGVSCDICGRPVLTTNEDDCACFHGRWARQSFEALWDSINGKRSYSWAANPFVWAISLSMRVAVSRRAEALKQATGAIRARRSP